MGSKSAILAKNRCGCCKRVIRRRKLDEPVQRDSLEDFRMDAVALCPACWDKWNKVHTKVISPGRAGKQFMLRMYKCYKKAEAVGAVDYKSVVELKKILQAMGAI